MTTDPSAEIQKIWSLRNSQRIDEAENAYHLALQQPALSAETELELMLVQASLLRAKRKIEEAEELLAQSKKKIEAQGLIAPYNYYLQRGLNLYWLGYFPSALEFFVRAQELANSPEETALALGNRCLCLDNLNLPFQKSLAQLQSMKTSLSKDYYANTLFPQIDTFTKRIAFRQGNISAAVQSGIERSPFSQTDYFQLWISQLPYVKAQAAPGKLAALVEAPHFLWKSYRLETLSLDSRFGNREPVKISERIDRLYLWLWQWMVAPETLPVQALETCWSSLDPCDICTQTTAEDLVLLKICIRWSRLFDSRWIGPSEDWLKKSLPPKLYIPPLFELEMLVQDFFEAFKQRERAKLRTLASEIANHPCSQISSTCFSDLISGALRQESETPSALYSLGRRVALTLNPRPQKQTSKSLTIDPSTSHWQKGSEEGVSKALCQLVLHLQSQKTLSFDEVMELCFSIPSYSEDHHRPKIMNLLTRLRKMLPASLELYTKDERLYSKGDFSKICILQRENIITQWALPALFDRPCIEQNQHHMDRWIQPRIVVKQLNGKTSFNRADLQTMLKLSKATTNRLLQRWQNEGFIRSESAGRSIRYHIDTTYFSRLKSIAS